MAFLTNEGASSSSSTHRWNYDVFLSFRGEDTRYNFTGHLYKALCDQGFNTFIDNDLQRGEEISMELLKAIELSMISIVVFSKNFAFSTQCLNELVKIFECRNNGQLVLPIFYKVSPSEIRNLDGEFGIALAEHEEKFKDDIEKIQRWRTTLTEAANLSGFPYNDRMKNLKFLIGNVHIGEELEYLPNELRFLEWHVFPLSLSSKCCPPEQLVALKMSSILFCKFITKLPDLCSPNLEKLDLRSCENLIEVHESIGFLEKLKVWNLNGCSQLQILPSTLMLKSLGYFNLNNCSRLQKFPDIHPEMTCLKKLYLFSSGIRELPSSLLYLTGLDSLGLIDCGKLANFLVRANESEMQEEVDIPSTRLRLACNSFHNFSGPTGFLSMTHLNLGLCVEIKAELDSWMQPDYFPVLTDLDLAYTGIVTIPESISRFARLQNLYIRNCKKLREIPRLPQSIRTVDALRCYRLDSQSLRRLWNQRYDSLSIHDLVQQMGREIFQQESEELQQCSRIWCYEDAHKLLTGNMGSNKIRSIMLLSLERTEVSLKAIVFKRMKNLKFLVGNVHIGEALEYLLDELRFLTWREFPLSLSSKCCLPRQLVVLKMSKSNIILENAFKQV
ncbi:hypothetical protein SO802_009072 [Lithocarpus litseifolius]|uniref:TIR domain-containing protein n=1 Tax=Lithocarpus litseifolius TaxID=425828 RepID=A0AAW2DEF1_9ROSI